MSGSALAPAEGTTQPRSASELVRSIAVVGIAGLVTGIVVGGLGSRLFMRIAAATALDSAQGALTEAEARVGAITFDGTMAIVVFVGIGAGIVGAVCYAAFVPWIAWAGRFRGLVFGVVLLAVGSATSDVLNPDNFDFALLGNRAISVTLIVLLFLGFGLMMDATVRFFDRRFPPMDDQHRTARAIYGAITALGVAFGLLLVPTFFFSRSACDCDPPIVASSFVVVTAVGTLVLWGNDRNGFGALTLHRSGPRLLGAGGHPGLRAVAGRLRRRVDPHVVLVRSEPYDVGWTTQGSVRRSSSRR